MRRPPVGGLHWEGAGWRFRRKVTPCVRFKVTPLSDFKMTPTFRRRKQRKFDSSVCTDASYMLMSAKSISLVSDER